MKPQSESFRDEFEVIKLHYVEKLSKQVRDIRTKWHLFKKYQVKRELIENIYSNVHKISGSAGVFGCGAVGDIAAGLEIELKWIMEHEATLSIDEESTILRHIESLMHEVDVAMERRVIRHQDSSPPDQTQVPP